MAARARKAVRSPHLVKWQKTLNHNGIDTEIFQAGNPDTDNVKAAAAKLKEADALIVGSPVYWASPSGQIIEFMDKLCSMAGKDMLHKPAAAVASARRAGTTATLDVLQKYFSYHEMPVVSANYWNMVHGNTPAEVAQDEEGLQIMRSLGKQYGMASEIPGKQGKRQVLQFLRRKIRSRQIYPLNMVQ